MGSHAGTNSTTDSRYKTPRLAAVLSSALEDSQDVLIIPNDVGLRWGLRGYSRLEPTSDLAIREALATTLTYLKNSS